MNFFHSEQEIKALVKQFQERTLPIEQWTHKAHLTVACWHLLSYSEAAATCLLRSGIITYNVAVGSKNTPDGGYHETLTLFWIKIIGDFLVEQEGTLLIKINAFLASPYADKTIPFQYYSKPYLMSTEGRAKWINPDLKEL